MKKKYKINNIEIDFRAKDCFYITIGKKLVIYFDNTTGKNIIESWKLKNENT